MVAPSWRRTGTKEDITLLPEEYIGNCARSMDWNYQTSGTPADVVENDEVELYWVLTFHTDMTVAHNRPDVILVDEAIRTFLALVTLM